MPKVSQLKEKNIFVNFWRACANINMDASKLQQTQSFILVLQGQFQDFYCKS